MTYQQKEYLYLLVIILKNLINYRGWVINIEIELIIINIEIELIIIKIKGKEIIISFNILLLGYNKAILGMLWL